MWVMTSVEFQAHSRFYNRAYKEAYNYRVKYSRTYKVLNLIFDIPELVDING